MVKNLADELNTTVGFLLGESNDMNLLKDPTMMKRLHYINTLSDKDCILNAIDNVIGLR